MAFVEKHEESEFKIYISKLRDIEQSILNYMLLSKTNFLKIKSDLLVDDFTFKVHKRIFKDLCVMENFFLSNNLEELEDLNLSLYVFTHELQKEIGLNADSILDILSQPPSTHIEQDLRIINTNSMEKEIVINKPGVLQNVIIETKEARTELEFISGRLINIESTNITVIPEEAYDTFGDTFDAFSQLDFKPGKVEAQIAFYGDEDNPDGIATIYLKKDIEELKWVENLLSWADKNNLSDDMFPRDIYKLKEMAKLDISNMGISELPKEIGKLRSLKELIFNNNKITKFPIEIYLLKNLELLSFINNEISFIADDIINLKKLRGFVACNNKIITLPSNFYKLNDLLLLCLHNNELTEIANEIGNLSKLKLLSISNTDISIIPKSISNLKALESLDIENTKILEIPIDLSRFHNLESLCFNDDLLVNVLKSMGSLSMNAINLTASNFDKKSKIIESLNLKLDTEIWMEEEYKLDYGCVKLKIK